MILKRDLKHTYQAKKGLPLFDGDTIVTQEKGQIRLKFNDESITTLAPGYSKKYFRRMANMRSLLQVRYSWSGGKPVEFIPEDRPDSICLFEDFVACF